MASKQQYKNILDKTIKDLTSIIDSESVMVDVINNKNNYISLQQTIINYFKNTKAIINENNSGSIGENGNDVSYSLEEELDYAAEIHNVIEYLQYLLIEYKNKLNNKKERDNITTDILGTFEYIKSIGKVIYGNNKKEVLISFNDIPITFVYSHTYAAMARNITFIISGEDITYKLIEPSKSADTQEDDVDTNNNHNIADLQLGFNKDGRIESDYSKDMFYQSGPLLPIRSADTYIHNNIKTPQADNQTVTVLINFRNKIRYCEHLFTTDKSNNKDQTYKLMHSRYYTNGYNITAVSVISRIAEISVLLNGILSYIAPDATKAYISQLVKYIGNDDLDDIAPNPTLDTFIISISNDESKQQVRDSLNNSVSEFNLNKHYLDIFHTITSYILAGIKYRGDTDFYRHSMFSSDSSTMDSQPHVSGESTRSIHMGSVDSGFDAKNTCMGSNSYLRDITTGILKGQDNILIEGLSRLYEWLTTYNTQDSYNTYPNRIFSNNYSAYISSIHTLRLPEINDLNAAITNMDIPSMYDTFINIIKNPKLLYCTLFIPTPINVRTNLKHVSPQDKYIDITTEYLNSDADITIDDVYKKYINTGVDNTLHHVNIYGILLLNNVGNILQNIYKTFMQDMYTLFRNDNEAIYNNTIVNNTMDHYIFSKTGSIYEATRKLTDKIPYILRIPTGSVYLTDAQEYKHYNKDVVQDPIKDATMDKYSNFIINNVYKDTFKLDKLTKLPNILDTTWINIQNNMMYNEDILSILKEIINTSVIIKEYEVTNNSFTMENNISTEDLKNLNNVNKKNNNFMHTNYGSLTKFILQLEKVKPTKSPLLNHNIINIFYKLWASIYGIYNMHMLIGVNTGVIINSNGVHGADTNNSHIKYSYSIYMPENTPFNSISDMYLSWGSINTVHIANNANNSASVDRVTYSMLQQDLMHLYFGSTMTNDEIININYVYNILIDLLYTLHTSIKIVRKTRAESKESGNQEEVASFADIVPELVASLLYPLKDTSDEQLNEYAIAFASHLNILLDKQADINLSSKNKDAVTNTAGNTSKVAEYTISHNNLLAISKVLLNLPKLAFSTEVVDFIEDIYSKVYNEVDSLFDNLTQDKYTTLLINSIITDLHEHTLDKLYMIDSPYVIAQVSNLYNSIFRADSLAQNNSVRYSMLYNIQAAVPSILGNSNYVNDMNLLFKQIVNKHGNTYHSNILSYLLLVLMKVSVNTKDSVVKIEGNNDKATIEIQNINSSKLNTPYNYIDFKNGLLNLMNIVKRL